MSNRQQLSDEQKKQLEISQQRLDELTQKYKGPILNLLTQCSQIIPNVVDQLVHECLNLESKIYDLTSKNQKIQQELSVLKATSKKEAPTSTKNSHNI